MLKVVMCGHTGSSNRGCEAIVRSTIKLLEENNIKTQLASYCIEEDKKAGLGDIVDIISYSRYKSKFSPCRIYNGLAKKMFHNDMPYESYLQKNVFKVLLKSDCAIAIGGDTYCYGRNSRVPVYCLNRFAEKKHKKSILWSCSIDAEKIDEEMKLDLLRYDKIFPRECLTYQNLLKAGIPDKKIIQMSDSAFALQTQKVSLPSDFSNVMAYNPSYTLGIKENKHMIMKNRIYMLNEILQHTNMKVALIPHVYRKDFGDLVTCREIYEQLVHRERVFLFEKEYNCEQLKYIVSHCRMLIAERTHASIAGYSSGVPTFVVGYSVKSRGISTDLFGTTEHYVIPYQDLTDETKLMTDVQMFMNKEEETRNILENRIPDYVDLAHKAASELKKIIASEDIS